MKREFDGHCVKKEPTEVPQHGPEVVRVLAGLFDKLGGPTDVASRQRQRLYS